MSDVQQTSPKSWYFALSEKKQFYLRQYGVGERLLIALHGFGEQGSAFAQMPELMAQRYTLVAIDLPFHGQTKWIADAYQPADIISCIQHILSSLSFKKFDCIAHSLGGRIALACSAELDGTMERLYLLAPDGVDNAYGLWTERLPFFLRKAIAKRLDRPAWILQLSARLYQWKWIDRFSYRYLQHHLATADNRKRMISTWLSMEYFKLTKQAIIHLLQEASFSTLIFLGKRDTINTGKFSQGIAKQVDAVDVILLNAGHALIQPTYEWLIADLENATH
ncbi:MAG: alpha/beta hydrolase [Bacteroidota bacterium]